MNRFFRRWLPRLVVTGVILVCLLYWTSCTTVPALPAGVRKETQHLMLAGCDVAVTLYYPAHRDEAPLVVVAHGFTRSKRYMAGWGADLAGQGFIVAVPTQPALANHALNGRVLAELVSQMRDGRISMKMKPGKRTALVGFSMGGLTTLLAAARQPLDAWVGLDPVDMDGTGVAVAKKLAVPCAILRSEPAAWNKHGNARQIGAALPELRFSLKVRNATHLDAESPTDLLGQLACGFVDAERQSTFKRYTIAFLRATLLDDVEAQRLLDGASKDEALDEVKLSRQP